MVQITEVLGMEGDTITLQDLFFFENQGIDDAGRVTGRYQATGIIPTFLEKLTLYGETVDRDMFAIGEEASPEPLRRRP